MIIDGVISTLRVFYFKIISFIFLLGVASFVLDWQGFRIYEGVSPKWVAWFLLVLCASLGAALPIWFRILFAMRSKKKKIDLNKYIFFEKVQICMGLGALSIVPVGHFLRLPAVNMGAVALFGLYGCYYHFPTRQRILLGVRIFRLNAFEHELNEERG